MDINSLVLYILFSIIFIVFFLNIIKVFINIFSRPKKIIKEENPLRVKIRSDIDTQLRPHLRSLDSMYEKSGSSASTLGSFVFSVFKEKFSSHIEKDEKMVEEEICKCCSEYEGAECKESYCLEGSGLSCPK